MVDFCLLFRYKYQKRIFRGDGYGYVSDIDTDF